MRPAVLLGLAALLAMGTTPVLADPADPERTLSAGRPLRIALGPDETTWTGVLDVPQRARGFSVITSCSAAPGIDLFLRRGRPFGDDPVAEADVHRPSAGAYESARVTGPLTPGRWHVLVRRQEPPKRALRFEIVAFVSGAGDPPGIEPGKNLRAPQIRAGRGLAVRTFFPSGVPRMKVVSSLIDDGVTYKLTGPGRQVTTGAWTGQVVLDAERHRPGVYVLRLSPGPRPFGDTYAIETQMPARPADPGPAPRAQRSLEIGMRRVLTLAPDATRMVTVNVPKGTRGFRVEARALQTTDEADVDLYVRRGARADALEDTAHYFALSTAPTERLVVAGHGELPPGAYFVEVELVEPETTLDVALKVQPLDAEDGFSWGSGEPSGLAPGTWRADAVDLAEDGRRWYRVDVPAGTRSVHARLFGAGAPLELLWAEPSTGAITRRAITARVDEPLDVTFAEPLAGAESFLLGVLSRNPYEGAVPYRVAIAFDAPPPLPESARWPPFLTQRPDRPLDRAIAASVEITIRDEAGGSGTCVSPRGHVLTSRHILALDDGDGPLQRDGILIAFPIDVRKPPVQSFVARLVFEDADRDLALLEITRDIHGRPLAKDLPLPWVPLGDPEGLELGDPLTVLGYPAYGSERTRTPLILTRGHVAGLEAKGERLAWIKTDAWIAAGHSGGAVLDRDLRLVGVAAATLGEGEEMGLAAPVSDLPAVWRTRLEDARSPGQR